MNLSGTLPLSLIKMNNLEAIMKIPTGPLCPLCEAELLYGFSTEGIESCEVWCPECGLWAEGKDLDDALDSIGAC